MIFSKVTCCHTLEYRLFMVFLTFSPVVWIHLDQYSLIESKFLKAFFHYFFLPWIILSPCFESLSRVPRRFENKNYLLFWKNANYLFLKFQKSISGISCFYMAIWCRWKTTNFQIPPFLENLVSISEYCSKWIQTSGRFNGNTNGIYSKEYGE